MHTVEHKYTKKLKKISLKKIAKDDLDDIIEAEEVQKVFKQPRYKRHKKAVYNNVQYHSGWEAKFAQELDKLKLAGEVINWQRQVKIEINTVNENGKVYLTDKPAIELKMEGKNFEHICNYYIDFVVDYTDGRREYIEVKGVETELWKLKFRLFESIFKVVHPEIVIKIIK